MADIIYDPDVKTDDPDIHKCWKELPGKVYSGTNNKKYYTQVTPGTVVQCSCKNVYKAVYTGYSDLGCEYEYVGWWEARKYKKKAGSW